MRVDLQILLRQLVTILGAPDGRVAEEETLQTGETIDFRRLSQRSFNGLHGTVLLTACRLVKSERICFERNVHATQVADVLTDGQSAVHMRSLSWIVGVFFGKLRWHERVVLVDEFLCELLEIGLVFFGPPVVELAVAVVLGTLIVEAVADLMADHRSDTAIVRGVFGVRVEERRLQNGGREHDHVHGRLIIGVHRLRIHQPFVLVDALADFGQLIAGLIQVGGTHVLGKTGILAHIKRGIVTPMVRIADLRHELGELLQRLLLGFFAKPGGTGNGHAVGIDQIADQLFHTLLRRLGEVPLHIFAAHILAANAVDQRNAALPTHTLLLLTRQRLAIELEIRLIEFVRQLQGGADDHMHACPQLEIVEIRGLPECVKTGEEAGLMHHHMVENASEIKRLHLSGGSLIICGLPGFDPCVEIIIGEHSAQFRIIGGIIGLHRITGCHIVPMVRGDTCLHVEETLGLSFGLLVIGGELRVLQLLGHHIDVCFTNRRIMVFTVIRLIGQSQARLFNMDDVGFGSARIAIHGNADQVRAASRVHRAQRAGEFSLVGSDVNSLQLVFNGRESGSVDGVDVKETRIQGVGLLGRAVVVFENLTNLVFGIFGELIERTITGTIIRKTIHVDPWAVDIAEQILRRAGHGGERCRIDTRIQSGTHGFTLSIFGDKTVYLKRIIIIPQRHA